MKMSCINTKPNEEALLIINSIAEQYPRFEELETRMYLESAIDLLTRLAEEDEEFLELDNIKRALTHLARTRNILRYLKEGGDLKQIDILVDQAISLISKDAIYLLNYLSEVEQ
jgi:hypothetical protein